MFSGLIKVLKSPQTNQNFKNLTMISRQPQKFAVIEKSSFTRKHKFTYRVLQYWKILACVLLVISYSFKENR